MICILLFPVFLSVCAHFDVQCFDLYIHVSIFLSVSIFSAMSIKLSEQILHTAFATKAPGPQEEGDR